ncbi:alkaline phosphatase family protein [Tautonia sociabilis]|uniref:Alkaline phosphatase family protein n=1 Tax=Tautonia sociabilis TaxID=2080755 RepID=A0A432MFI6_9BACT|nr:nucleotide pyrophosphatase/phosphodiesterase family protein [Tautonia sociabilis]RUL84988.1 alkaline phosphatase family protein [Tautonia sociabilis]
MPEPNAAPIVLVSAVGLTPKLLPMAPRLDRIARSGWSRPVLDCEPAVTCSAQATALTGRLPREHGIVGNGWLFRETGEVRFWQQCNRLVQAELLYEIARTRARRRGRPFRVAKLFWWFNQGAEVEFSVTPKPLYGADGSKVFGIWGSPPELPARLEREIGPFPFASFWGPMAGLPATSWIARGAAEVLRADRPDLTLVYLPHLDYDPQRFGPSGCDLPRLVGELDEAAAPLLEAAEAVGAKVWVFGEYAHRDVSRAVLPNRTLREEGFLSVRPGAFGDHLETFQSRAFAVCDHQHAHVYVRRAEDIPLVRDRLAEQPGVARVFVGDERGEIGLDHPRSGELVLRAEPDSWFAYPFWLDDRDAPDYARTVDIHRKPGYDPVELYFDPKLAFPKLRAMRRLLQKTLGFRTLMDLIGLDPSIVRGSHGVPGDSDADRPVLIGHGPSPEDGVPVPMTAIRDLLLEAMDLSD